MLPRIVAALVLLIMAVSFTSPSALAQTPNGHWVDDPKNIATPAFVYDLPPAGFNPLAASDTELAQWGLPPRPSASDAKAYARWTRMVTSTRITPQLKFTNIYHGPAKGLKTGLPTVSNASAATSENWSGFVVSEANGTFAHNNSEALLEYTIPAIAPGSGSCGSATWASSQWAGFDGWTSGDVLQAGTETNCGNSDYAWYEWYPFAETELSLAVGAGDFMELDVYYTTTSPYGHAFLLNEVSHQSTLVGFNPPSGTVYEGNSAEWIVERPEIGGSLTDLPNYANMILTLAEAYDGTNFYFPSSVPAGTIYYVDMTCPPWNPSSACTTTTTISYTDPSPADLYTFFMTAEGPAY
jgi:hypothetical protein